MFNGDGGIFRENGIAIGAVEGVSVEYFAGSIRVARKEPDFGGDEFFSDGIINALSDDDDIGRLDFEIGNGKRQALVNKSG